MGTAKSGAVQLPATLDLPTSYKVANRFGLNAHQLGKQIRQRETKMHPLGCLKAACVKLGKLLLLIPTKDAYRRSK